MSIFFSATLDQGLISHVSFVYFFLSPKVIDFYLISPVDMGMFVKLKETVRCLCKLTSDSSSQNTKVEDGRNLLSSHPFTSRLPVVSFFAFSGVLMLISSI